MNHPSMVQAMIEVFNTMVQCVMKEESNETVSTLEISSLAKGNYQSLVRNRKDTVLYKKFGVQ